jgi:MoxR-like ATPase
LAKIIQKRLASFKDPTSPLLTSALDFFEKLRQRNLRKSPSTAELINWLSVLARNGVAPNQRLDAARPQVEASLSALIKAQEDLEEAKRVVAEFCRAE